MGEHIENSAPTNSASTCERKWQRECRTAVPAVMTGETPVLLSTRGYRCTRRVQLVALGRSLWSAVRRIRLDTNDFGRAAA